MTESTKDKKKRPRPANLELKSSNLVVGDAKKSADMNDYALKCVSPGLPPLSAKMKSTILISKSIEAQQRHIIASRNANSSSASTNPDSQVDEDENEIEIQDKEHEDTDKRKISINNNDKQPQQYDETNNESKKSEVSESLADLPNSNLTASMDDLSIPSSVSNKRFKRDKAPPPLNLSNVHNAPRPIIKSAPIYNINHSYFTPVPTKRQAFKEKKLGSTTQQYFPPLTSTSTLNTGRPRMNFTPLTAFDPNLYQRRPIPISANPYAINSFQFRPLQNIVPKTATSLRNPAFFPQKAGPPLTQQQLERYQQQLLYQQQQWAKFKAYRDSRRVNHVTDVFKGDATRYAPPSAQPLSAQRAFFDLDDTKPPQAVPAKGGVSAKNNEQDNGDEKIEEEEEDDENDPESNAIEPDAKVGLNLRKNLNIKSELKLDNNIFRFNFERTTNSADSDKQRFLNHCATAWDQFARLS